jgi:hypothetical protein
MSAVPEAFNMLDDLQRRNHEGILISCRISFLQDKNNLYQMALRSTSGLAHECNDLFTLGLTNMAT